MERAPNTRAQTPKTKTRGTNTPGTYVNINKKYRVQAFETPAISTERDRVRREQLARIAPKALPGFEVEAPHEDAAKQLVRARYEKERRVVRSIAHSVDGFVVYVEPRR